METRPTTPAQALLGRVVWIMLGPMALIVLAVQISREPDGWLAPLDLAYLIVLAATLCGRWLEFRSEAPQTGMGEPARPGDLARYLRGAAAIYLAIWVLANSAGGNASGARGLDGPSTRDRLSITKIDRPDPRDRGEDEAPRRDSGR